MAQTITIPSPSTFLTSPLSTPATSEFKKPYLPPFSTPPPSHTTVDMSRQDTTTAVTKRKQSKSRNGCITCKAKRLKCDETKPSCQQCARRSVPCGGYKKDFKWRPFAEANFINTGKPSPTKPKKASPSRPTSAPMTPRSVASTFSPTPSSSRPNSSLEFYPNDLPYGLPLPPTSCIDQSLPVREDGYTWSPSPYGMPPRSVSMPESVEPSSTASINTTFNDSETVHSFHTAPSSIASGQSPRPLSLLLPDPDLDVCISAPEYCDFSSQYADSVDDPAPLTYPQSTLEEDADIEEIVRQPTSAPDPETWVMQLPSPSPSGSSSSSSERSLSLPDRSQSLFRPLHFSPGSPEMLMLSFDRQTCGILSMVDGPSENPWRTMIWPLTHSSPALYHAVASMTAFHMSKHQPQLRVQGIEHMRQSLHELALGLGKGGISVETAIATTLALAFSESWDQHTSTGIDHIKGAKVLVNQALTRHRGAAPSERSGEELARLRFLCNTWLYMDVIARLTSVDADDSVDFDAVTSLFGFSGPLAGAGSDDSALDPLMGAATTLFPLIGRTADLVRRVRARADSANSPAIISAAVALKTALEAWVPPSFFLSPEDASCTVSDGLQTAEAYRLATLLYLHQAVPEIPSALSSAQLAKKCLACLATVPITSRAVIVQIFPLMAAGCEATNAEDREWVRERWHWMNVRMKIGNVEKAREVVDEVWRRKDQLEERKKGGLRKQGLGSRQSSPALEDLDPEASVRGSAHWLGVMQDWKWEILLG